MTREMLMRLTLAALLLVAVGVAANRTVNQGMFSTQRTPHFQPLPSYRFDLVHHRWIEICGPHPSAICAEESLLNKF